MQTTAPIVEEAGAMSTKQYGLRQPTKRGHTKEVVNLAEVAIADIPYQKILRYHHSPCEKCFQFCAILYYKIPKPAVYSANHQGLFRVWKASLWYRRKPSSIVNNRRSASRIGAELTTFQRDL